MSSFNIEIDKNLQNDITIIKITDEMSVTGHFHTLIQKKKKKKISYKGMTVQLFQ